MTDLGKLLLWLGGVLVLAGLVFLLLGKTTNLSLGRLPGDIVYRGKNTTVYFPLATSLAISVLLTLVWYVIGKIRH